MSRNLGIPREFPVKDGGQHDQCPLCRIWRCNAGFIKESCGEWFGQTECFVAPTTPSPPRSASPDRKEPA